MIDIHLHLVNPGSLWYDDMKNKFESYVSGLDYGLLLAATYPASLGKRSFSNQELCHVLDMQKNIYGLAAFSLSRYIEEQAVLSHPKVRGIKFYTGYYAYFYTTVISQYIEKSISLGKDIFMFHGGICHTKQKQSFHPQDLEGIIQKFPTWKFIIAHMGNPFFLETIALLEKYPNVFVDISGIFGQGNPLEQKYKQTLQLVFYSLAQKGLLGKVLFWTDFPLLASEEMNIILSQVVEKGILESIHSATNDFFVNFIVWK